MSPKDEYVTREDLHCYAHLERLVAVETRLGVLVGTLDRIEKKLDTVCGEVHEQEIVVAKSTIRQKITWGALVAMGSMIGGALVKVAVAALFV